MNYATFVRLRQGFWEDFGSRIDEARRHPRRLDYDQLEALAVDYRRLLHDQALARSRFAGTATSRRLERLAIEATHLLQADDRFRRWRPMHWWRVTFPAAFRRTLPAIGVSFALFLIAMSFGLVLAAIEPALGMTFLPPEAIENLRRGTLWTESIFAVTPPAVASTQIATNNLSVVLTAWAGGALAGLLSLWVILLNGLMLGAVIATTMHYGMVGPLLDFIAAHGPLEISLILVAAGAGLTVGQAMVRATDVPRGVILRAAARDAVTVALGCLPWILLLGFVEGFVSPRPELPTISKALIGWLLWSAFVATVAIGRVEQA
ncbi:MAG: stage II sporulation protein M [Acidobacteriota bacterium]